MHGITVGFYGMTHLGLISAVAAASKNFNVIGFDADEKLIINLQKHVFPICEPQLAEMAAENKMRLNFTAEINVLLQADIIYIAIDVPTNGENQSNLEPIAEALEMLRLKLRQDQIIVVLSQVCPGFTRAMLFPAGQLFYQVETLVFGNAIERAALPERFIVGRAKADQVLPQKYQAFLQAFNCPILPMRYESAELAKISINMYLVASVMTSNMLAELASAVGADWQEIVPTLRLDKRIGQHAYLIPGLGISGGNLERDILTVLKQAEANALHAELAKTWIAESRYYKDWVFRCVQEFVLSRSLTPTIAILGLAYKPNTHSIKNSPSIELIKNLNGSEAMIRAHDPMVSQAKIDGVQRCDSIAATLNAADVVILMTPWNEYSQLSTHDLERMQGRIIIDPFRILSHQQLHEAGFLVLTLGVKYPAKQKEFFYA